MSIYKNKEELPSDSEAAEAPSSSVNNTKNLEAHIEDVYQDEK